MLRYDGDSRLLSMAEIEKILVRKYGDSEHNRESGCYVDGRGWLSVEDVLSLLSAEC